MWYVNAGLGKTVQVAAFLAAVYCKTGTVADVDTNRLIVTAKRTVKPTIIISPRHVSASNYFCNIS
jgi:hypothetical protein